MDIESTTGNLLSDEFCSRPLSPPAGCAIKDGIQNQVGHLAAAAGAWLHPVAIVCRRLAIKGFKQGHRHDLRARDADSPRGHAERRFDTRLEPAWIHVVAQALQSRVRPGAGGLLVQEVDHAHEDLLGLRLGHQLPHVVLYSVLEEVDYVPEARREAAQAARHAVWNAAAEAAELPKEAGVGRASAGAPLDDALRPRAIHQRQHAADGAHQRFQGDVVAANADHEDVVLADVVADDDILLEQTGATPVVQARLLYCGVHRRHRLVPTALQAVVQPIRHILLHHWRP
mmetsp:Transcript_5028/g.20089  ORF Transcript_5028/g.20089 Transcript_5028/m.20089 type:complete len:286 (+) Transcript_5028:70-927(+)|eukprot:scaffold1786_cov250-Pinguiococcus_pyrenoidosus.AAC.7